MKDPKHLREQARRCRNLAKTAIEPGVIEQLRVWSVELADEADAAERRAAETQESLSCGIPVRSDNAKGVERVKPIQIGP